MQASSKLWTLCVQHSVQRCRSNPLTMSQHLGRRPFGVQNLRAMACASPATMPNALTTSTSTLVFIGAHVPLSRTDARLVAWHAADLRRGRDEGIAPQAELWLLLLNESSASAPNESDIPALAARLGAGVCLWTPAQLFKHMPALRAGLDASAAYRSEPDYHMQRYYWCVSPTTGTGTEYRTPCRCRRP